MSDVVVDASALLAFLRREPGADVVERALAAGAVVSAVNLAEVAGRLADAGLDPGPLLAMLPVEVVPLDAELAIEVGRLRSVTREAGLSLGDRACLALARHRRSPAMTTDRAWARVDVGGVVQLVR